MPLSFVESMSGTVIDAAGAERRISFTVSARGRGGGHFALSGIVAAPPWAPAAPIDGTLQVAIAPPSIAYRFELVAADGRALVFTGEKHLKALAPVASLTRMPVVLRDSEGHVLAEGQMRFRLAQLPGFLWSWLPGARRRRRRLDVERRALTRGRLEGG
ncbi:MAG: hypothetical protein HY903_17860 [Deltaproteobacteria bacterium]|nr:hypothetical protein [Deltaproteobacteria bacterium]